MHFQTLNVTQQIYPEQEKPNKNPLPGGTTQGRASDPDPLLASLLVSTNARWGGNSKLVCLFYSFSPFFTFYDRDVVALLLRARNEMGRVGVGLGSLTVKVKFTCKMEYRPFTLHFC